LRLSRHWTLLGLGLLVAVAAAFWTRDIVARNASVARDVKLFLFFPVPDPALALYDTGYGFNELQAKPVTASGLLSVDLPAATADDAGLPLVDPGAAAAPVQVPKAVGPADDRTLIAFILAPHSPAQRLRLRAGSREHVVSLPAGPDTESMALIRRDGAGLRMLWTGSAFTLNRWDADVSRLRGVEIRARPGQPEAAAACEPCLAALVGGDNAQFVPLAATPHAGRVAVRWSSDTAIESAPPPLWQALRRTLPVAVGALAFLAVLVLPAVAGRWRAGFPWLALAVTAAWTVFFGLFALAWWPGVMIVDSLSPVIQALAGSYGIWYGIGHPLTTTLVEAVSDHTYTLVVQIGLHVAFFSAATVFFLRRGFVLPTALTCLFAVAVAVVGIGSVYHYRDALSGVLVAAILFALWRTFLDPPAPRGLEVRLLALLALSVLAVAYRQDNLVLVAAVVLGAVVLLRGWRARLALPVAALAGLAALGWATDRITGGSEAERRNYAVTPLLNGIGAVLHKPDFEARDKEAAREVISRVIDYDVIRREWTPYDIVYWHQHGKMQPSAQDVSDLRALFLELAVMNPWTFLKARTQTMLATIVPSPRTVMMDDLGRHGQARKLLSDYGYWRANPSPLLPAGIGVLEWYRARASHLPQFAAVVACLLLFPWIPRTAFVASVFAAKLGLFFLLQPASVFSYLYDLHVLGIFLPLMAVAERRRIGRPTAAAPAGG